MRLNEEARGARRGAEGGDGEASVDDLPVPVYAAAAPVVESQERSRVRIVHTRPDGLFAGDEEAD